MSTFKTLAGGRQQPQRAPCTRRRGDQICGINRCCTSTRSSTNRYVASIERCCWSAVRASNFHSLNWRTITTYIYTVKQKQKIMKKAHTHLQNYMHIHTHRECWGNREQSVWNKTKLKLSVFPEKFRFNLEFQLKVLQCCTTVGCRNVFCFCFTRVFIIVELEVEQICCCCRCSCSWKPEHEMNANNFCLSLLL